MNPNTTSQSQVLFIALVSACIGFLLGVITTQYLKKDIIVTPLSTDSTVETNNTTSSVNEEEETTTPNAAVAEQTGFTISIATLPETQQFALRSMGVDGDELVITSTMVACAEVKLGAARVTEIKNGAGVSMSEGVTLIGCYSE